MNTISATFCVSGWDLCCCLLFSLIFPFVLDRPERVRASGLPASHNAGEIHIAENTCRWWETAIHVHIFIMGSEEKRLKNKWIIWVAKYILEQGIWRTICNIFHNASLPKMNLTAQNIIWNMSNAKIQSIEDEEAFWTGIRGLWSHHHSAANILHVFFQKATESQLQKCGEAIFDMH